VYRTQDHNDSKDSDASWRFENQGVYDDSGRVKDGTKEKVNFSAELLEENSEGTIRLSVRSLSMQELSLLLLVCNTTWRLGGGKPLGLGHCNVEVGIILDEFGNEFPQDDKRLSALDGETMKQFNAWKATQKPIERLRYPRAVIRNDSPTNKKAGLSWFSKFASPKKGRDGLEVTRIGGNEISGQVLPTFDDNGTDFLYGYDGFLCEKTIESMSAKEKQQFGNLACSKEGRVNYFPKIVEFDESKHITGEENSGGNTSQNRETRREAKRNR
jgi:hypothetical protein